MAEEREAQQVRLEAGGAHAEARFFPGPGAAGVVLVGGVGGGFDSPARDLYARLSLLLPDEGVSVLRVRFRLPGELGEAVADVRAGVAFLGGRGIGRVGLVGHSFGGGVVIRAAVREPRVRAVVALATQTFGTEEVGALRRPLLLLHGERDEVLSPTCSVQVFQRAGREAELQLLPGAGHLLDEVAEEVRARVHGFLVDRLQPGAAPMSPGA